MLYHTQSDRDQLLKWVAFLEDDMVSNPVTGQYMVRMGKNIAQDNDGDGLNDISYHTLPEGIGMQKVNSRGRYFVYCPIGSSIDSSVTASAVINNGSVEGDISIYNARVINNGTTNYIAQTDVVLDSSIPDNIAGFIMSSFSIDATVPTCQEVTYDGVNYLANNAIVKSISLDNAADPLTFNIDMVNNGESDISSYTNKVKTSNALKITYSLDSIPYNSVSSLDFCFDDSTIRKNIYIKGSYNGLTGDFTVINASAGAEINACNVNIYISNVIFKNMSIKSDNSNFKIKNSLVNDIVANHSEFEFSDLSYIKNTSASGILMDFYDSSMYVNDSVYLYSSSTNSNMVKLLNSEMHIKDSALHFEYDGSGSPSINSVIKVDSASGIFMNNGSINSSINNSSGLIENYGKTSLESSSIVVTSGNSIIQISGGGVLNLSKSTIKNTKPGAYGVIDESAFGIFGVDSFIVASNCWIGDLFNGSNGSYSSGTELSNRSSWKCN